MAYATDKKDWQYEVASGDTVLGFTEWLEHRAESQFGYIAGTNGKNGGRKVKHIHRPHNSDTMQTVCEDCGEEMDLRG